MDANERRELARRVLAAAGAGAKAALGTIWFLVKVMVPVTLLMALLGWTGVVGFVARIFDPILGVAGLPGEAILVLFASLAFNLFAAVGVAASLALDLRAMTILAVACLIVHNLVIETSLMRRTGSSRTKMITLRVLFAVGTAFAVDLLLPSKMSLVAWSHGFTASRAELGAHAGFLDMLGGWALGTLPLLVKVVVVMLLVMVAQRILEEFKVSAILSKVLMPVMPFLGFPPAWSRFWVASNVAGLPKATALVQAEIEDGKLKPQDGDLLNHHAAMCHSLLEESALMWVLGLSIFWIIIPRLVLAMALVWIERVRRHYFRRSFRAGVA